MMLCLKRHEQQYINFYIYVYTLTKIINATLSFIAPPPFFHELKLINLRLFLCAQKAYFSQILFTNLSKSVLVSTSSLPEIIHPPLGCGITRYWLHSMIIKCVFYATFIVVIRFWPQLLLAIAVRKVIYYLCDEDIQRTSVARVAAQVVRGHF